MPSSPIVQLLMVLVASGILFSLWKGGTAERAGAGIVAANMVAGILTNMGPAGLMDTLYFVNDGLTAVLLLVITLRFGAPWMGGVMLLYGVQFAMHSYYLVTGGSASDSAYLHAVINNVNFCAITLLLIIGAGLAWRRRVKKARRAAAAAPSSPAPLP